LHLIYIGFNVTSDNCKSICRSESSDLHFILLFILHIYSAKIYLHGATEKLKIFMYKELKNHFYKKMIAKILSRDNDFPPFFAYKLKT